ncbi:MAG: hypothetical protein KJN72_10715 [Woeseia sp.]|nr:hypothetical protein [Woeseia sp.]
MAGSTDTLIDALVTEIVADPIRLILGVALVGAGWVIVKLWIKLEESRKNEATKEMEMRVKLEALEARAWQLSVETMQSSRHREPE